MNEEEVLLARDSIIGDVEELVESGEYSLEEIIAEIEGALVHLVP